LSLLILSVTIKIPRVQNNQIFFEKMEMQRQVIFFIGYPAAGKGSQGKRLQERLKIPHV